MPPGAADEGGGANGVVLSLSGYALCRLLFLTRRSDCVSGRCQSRKSRLTPRDSTHIKPRRSAIIQAADSDRCPTWRLTNPPSNQRRSAIGASSITWFNTSTSGTQRIRWAKNMLISLHAITNIQRYELAQMSRTEYAKSCSVAHSIAPSCWIEDGAVRPYISGCPLLSCPERKIIEVSNLVETFPLARETELPILG